MRLPETDRTAPTVITVINILLHTVQLVKYAILLSRRTTQISTRSRINELRQTGSSGARILRLRIPAGFLRHNPIHVRTLTSRQAFHGCPCLALRISNTLNNAALNVLNSVANNVINGTCLICQAVNEFLGTRPHSVRHSPLAADLVNLGLNPIDKSVEARNPATATTPGTTGNDLAAPTCVYVQDVVVARCSPDVTELREQFTRLRKNTVKERHVFCVRTTGTVVSIERLAPVVVRVLRVPTNTLAPGAELGDPRALLLQPSGGNR